MATTESVLRKAVDKVLLKQERWDSSLDDDLFNAMVNSVTNPLYTQGIEVQPVSHVTANNTEYALVVVYNPYAIISKNMSIGICYYNCLNQAVVIVDDRFMQLSKEAREFTIQHEIGHVHHQHSVTSLIVGIRDINNEYEADAYAASSVGVDVAIRSLMEIKSLLKGLLYYASRKELDKRINKLKTK